MWPALGSVAPLVTSRLSDSPEVKDTVRSVSPEGSGWSTRSPSTRSPSRTPGNSSSPKLACWGHLPLEIAERVILTLMHIAIGDFNTMFSLRLINKAFASTYESLVQVYHPNAERQLKAILDMIASFVPSHPSYGKLINSDAMRMSPAIFSFLYTAIYHHCTKCTNNSSSYFYKMLSTPLVLEPFLSAMDRDQHAALFKMYIICIFKYLDRFYVKRIRADELIKVVLPQLVNIFASGERSRARGAGGVSEE